MTEQDPRLSIRFAPEEIQAIQDIANRKGMSRAGYIRKLVQRDIEHETNKRKGSRGRDA